MRSGMSHTYRSDQAEQHDYETIREVVGQGGDAPEKVDPEADPLEQIPLLGPPRVPFLYVQSRSGNRCVRDH